MYKTKLKSTGGESRQTQLHTVQVHLQHSGKGKTLGTYVGGLPGNGSDCKGAQGISWGDGKVLYLGHGVGYMTASESCTPKKGEFYIYNVDLQ